MSRESVRMMRCLLLAGCAVFGMLALAPQARADSSAPNIVNCKPENWCAYHRTTNRAWRHSPLRQINRDNVHQLKPVWIFQPGGERQGMHSTPLVIDGYMYVVVNPSTVYKLDAATGERIWVFEPDLDMAIVSRSFFAHSRGIAIGDGRVYLGTADGRVIAIDEKTGEKIWDVQLVDSAKDTAGFSGAGTFVSSDLFVIGQNGGEYPVEGRIFGLDPKTGELKWVFYTTGRDDPRALATWRGDSWKWGGGGSWQPGTVDYKYNQIIIGTGNPNPDYDYCGDRCRDPNADGYRSGDNLYTSSLIALDLDTGKLKWYFQEAPSDPYDYDAAVGEPVLIDDVDGRDVVVHPGKNGFMHVLDRRTGEPIKVYPAMRHQNWTKGYDLEKRDWIDMLWPKPGERTLVCPAIDGGHSWNAGTYHPGLNTFFRVVNEWCMWLTVGPKEGGIQPTAGTPGRVTEPFAQPFFNAEFEGTHPPGDRAHGRLVAWDPIAGTIKWERRYDVIPHSSLLSTAGGLLFNATYDGWLEALDAETGEILWRYNIGGPTNGGIISYAVNGRQYISVVSGHGTYVGRAIATLFADRLVGIKEEGRLVVTFALED